MYFVLVLIIDPFLESIHFTPDNWKGGNTNKFIFSLLITVFRSFSCCFQFNPEMSTSPAIVTYYFVLFWLLFYKVIIWFNISVLWT